jgi:hypothetical protein
MQDPQGGDMDELLEKILDAYAAAEPGPSRTTLAEWIREYPQFARELTEFTARWQLLEWTDEASAVDGATPSDTVPDDDRLLLRGMSAVQSAFYTLRVKSQVAQVREPEAARRVMRSAPPTDVPISSFATAAKQAGLTYAELKGRVGLSDALLRKIDRRLIDPLTIPTHILDGLAAALERSVEQVTAYVRLAPAFAAGAQHRAQQAPTLPKEREHFLDAVRNDVTLPGVRKRELAGADGESTPRNRQGTASHTVDLRALASGQAARLRALAGGDVSAEALLSETPASSAHLSHRATRYSMGAMPSTTPSRK